MCIDNHVSLLLSNAIGVAMLTPSLPAVKASGRRSLVSLSGTLHVPHQDVHTHDRILCRNRLLLDSQSGISGISSQPPFSIGPSRIGPSSATYHENMETIAEWWSFKPLPLTSPFSGFGESEIEHRGSAIAQTAI
jgi:hypothetical protein